MTLNLFAAIAAIAANKAPQLFGVRLIGLTPENGRKLLISVVFVAAITLIVLVAHRGLKRLTHSHERIGFWIQQVIRMVAAVVLVLGLVSIWVSDASNLATAAGLITAGVAIALQRVITAFAG